MVGGSRGRVRVFVRGVLVGNASYLGEVEYQGLVVSVFWGVGGYLRVCVRVVYGCAWLSKEPVIERCFCWYVCL